MFALDVSRPIDHWLRYLPVEQLQRVPLSVKWGVGLVFIEDLRRIRDGVNEITTAIRTLGRDARVLPTIIADRVRLASGKWYYEVRVASTTTSGRCSIGFSGILII